MSGPTASAGKFLAISARAATGLAGTILVVLFMAGLPLLLSEQSGRFVFAPLRLLEAAWRLFQALGDGSVFVIVVGVTPWDFRDLAPRALALSFLYTAIPGALGIGLGAFAGAAFRSRRRGTLDRLSDFALGTPDFLVIFIIQNAVTWLFAATGLHVALGGMQGRLSILPLLMMGLFPFLLA